jgi:hypothetical protein
MKLEIPYNKDVIEKEVSIAGAIHLISFAEFRYYSKHKQALGYAAYSPINPAANFLLFNSITGYEEPNAVLELDTKFDMWEPVYTQLDLAKARFSFHEKPMYVTEIIVKFGWKDQVDVIYEVDNQLVYMEHKLIPKRVFDTAKEIHEATKK